MCTVDENVIQDLLRDAIVKNKCSLEQKATPLPAFTQSKKHAQETRRREFNFEDQNISVKSYRLLSFVNNKCVVCEHIYFYMCYYWYCHQAYLQLYTVSSP
jgi:hypothetical protein